MSKQDSGSESAAQSSSNEDQIKKQAADSLYDDRGPKKIIRIITVMGYIFSVSFVAIGLSTYYIFLWEPPDPKLIERGRFRSGPRIDFFKADSDQSANFTDFYKDFIDHSNLSLKNRMGIFDNYDDYPDDKDRESSKVISVNKSLNTLRNTLVKILRAQRNELKISQNDSNSFHEEHFPANDFGSESTLKITSNKSRYENASKLGYPAEVESTNNNKTGNLRNNKANVTLSIKSTIISGVKSTGNRFLGTSNGAMNGSFRGIDQQDRKSTQFINLEKKRDNITNKED